MTRVTVRHETGDRFRISIRGHELVVDQPPPSGGDDGPTPTELFVASLAACAAFYARRFLARHGLHDGGLAISCESGWAEDHSRVASIAIRVEVPGGVPAELEPALLRAVDRCAVYESIRNVPMISVEISNVPRVPVLLS